MRKFFSLLYTLTIVGAVNAQTIAPKVAAQKAAGIFNKTNAAKGTTISVADPELAYVSVLNGDTCFYVFNNPQGGYAIIGGDLTSRDVLATVENGSFDINNLSSQTIGWLNQYAKQIRTAKKAGLGVAEVTAAGNESIAPLCSAKWGQDEPYLNFTPILPDKKYYRNFDGDNYVGTHAATGCVATAAAQALYALYKQGKTMPAHITKDISKKLNFCDEEDNILAQTGTLTYSKDRRIEWNILKDSYPEDGTDASSVEVGQLMYLMGLISDMGYGISSGAETTNLQEGLQKYIGMTNAKYLAKFDEEGSKQVVSDSKWESTIYNEFVENRPVIFTGADKDCNGGHCFLCDGYSKDNNLFHINWGWNGLGDGYFALSAASRTNKGQGEGSVLKPETGEPQTGSSSTDDYGYGNEIVYNLIYTGSDPYTTTAIKTINSDSTKTATRKYFDNGQIIIIKNGVKYNSVGQKI